MLLCDNVIMYFFSAKPWLAAQEDANQAIEKKYLSMWRRKKVRCHTTLLYRLGMD